MRIFISLGFHLKLWVALEPAHHNWTNRFLPSLSLGTWTDRTFSGLRFWSIKRCRPAWSISSDRFCHWGGTHCETRRRAGRERRWLNIGLLLFPPAQLKESINYPSKIINFLEQWSHNWWVISTIHRLDLLKPPLHLYKIYLIMHHSTDTLQLLKTTRKWHNTYHSWQYRRHILQAEFKR